jgi:hypothetical protein
MRARLRSKHARSAVVGLVAVLLGAVPVQAGWTGRPPGKNCVWEGRGATRNLTPAFYRRSVTLVASVDGLDGQELPISIEAVCDLPETLASGAARLAGSDGVVLRLGRTSVWEEHALKVGPAATALLDSADTVLVRGRLARPGAWREDKGGRRIATFRAGRIVVTD